MRNHLHTIALGLALCVVSGFADPLVVAAGPPFRGRAEGQVTSFDPGPAGVAITVVSQGTATHLGLFTREEQILLDPTTGTFAGSIVFTAANGDQLSGTVAGGFVSETSATGTYTFTGGKGRFAGSAGSAGFVLSTPDGVHFTASFEGTLD